MVGKDRMCGGWKIIIGVLGMLRMGKKRLGKFSKFVH